MPTLLPLNQSITTTSLTADGKHTVSLVLLLDVHAMNTDSTNASSRAGKKLSCVDVPGSDSTSATF